MSVLIKGMNKPTACYKCQLKTGKYCGILTENEKCAENGVLPNCPLVEVPPHGRLIDADALYRTITDELCIGCPTGDYLECQMACGTDDALCILDKAPTIIERGKE